MLLFLLTILHLHDGQIAHDNFFGALKALSLTQDTPGVACINWKRYQGAIQKSYIEQNVIISAQQSPNRRTANRADTQVCPYPTHLLIHDMPVGADLCVRPSVWACLHHFDPFTKCINLIAGPTIFAGISHHLCSNRIKFYISVDFQQITFFLNQTRFVTAFPQRPASLIFKIEISYINDAPMPASYG